MKKRGNGEGSIRQLKNGYWEARIMIGRNEKGKPKFKTFNGKQRNIVATKLTDYIANQKARDPEYASNMTVSEWLDIWYEDYVVDHVKTSTRASYEAYIKHYMKPNIGHIKLSALKKTDIEGMYAELRISGVKKKDGLSVKTINNVGVALHAALQEAMRREYIATNPASIAKKPTKRNTNSKKKEIEILTKNEQKQLELVCGNDVFGMGVTTLLYTGMRLGELLGLQWSDIDFDSKMIDVNKQVSRIKDYSPNPKAKTRLGIQDSTKTKTSSRSIPINTDLISQLTEYRKQQQVGIKKLGKSYCKLDMVFPRPGGNYMDPCTFRDKYRVILERAGLKRYTLHALRHTFATRALQAGIPIKVVSTILGHATVQITMDTYMHVMTDQQAEAMEQIAAFMKS